MIDGTAAGHTFKNGVCECGVRFVNIQHVTRADVNQPGISHEGNSTNYEIDQIQDLAKKMRAKVNTLFGWRD